MVAALAGIGVAVSFTGAVGILRMPDVYCRIQCSTKNVTVGALPLLIAVVVAKGPMTVFGGRALLIAFLLFVINPTASHALARAAYKAGVPMWSGAVVDVPRDRVADRAGDRAHGQHGQASGRP